MIDTAPIDTPPEREIYTQLTTNGQTGEGRGGRRRGERCAARADTRAPCDGRNTITVNKNDNIIREGRGEGGERDELVWFEEEEVEFNPNARSGNSLTVSGNTTTSPGHSGGKQEGLLRFFHV